MTLASNFIRTEGDGRLRCYRPKTVASRQLEASVGALVILLMVGFVAALSQNTPGKPAMLAAELRAPIVHAGVRVIPMNTPQAAALVNGDRNAL